MKFRLLLVFPLLFSLLSIQAQNEAAIWYFGQNAGIDFNSGAPVALTDGALSTLEGCSTISTSNGELLFYTDGITVWDKNHNVMPNGTGLLGNPSSTQSGIIVPKPNNPHKYYIFTVSNNAGFDGLRYSEVDLTLNNGNGDITANKNLVLLTPTTEKISAIEHANGTDIWVMTHGWGNANFFAFLVTPSGIGTSAVISHVGSVHSGDDANTIGYLKFSPDGERLALANTFDDNYVEIFDFDTATGIVSNPLVLDSVFYADDAGPYGIEFSPNSEVLYVSDLSFDLNESKIHQFDITLTTASEIINSDTILYDNTSTLGALQLAIDGKIYSAIGFETFLGVIENPDVLGIGASYSHNAVSLNGKFSNYGLPPFIQSFFAASILVENNCFGSSTSFTVNSSHPIDAILWDFGDGTTSTLENPSHNYAATGQYNVTATITSGADSIILDSVVVINTIPIANPVSNYILCDDASNDEAEVFNLATKDIELLGTQTPTDFFVSYYATADDAVNNSNPLPSNYTNTSNNQELFAKISVSDNSECYAISTFNLIVTQEPIAHAISDVVFCDDTTLDGQETINLAVFNTDVLNGQIAADFNITYHLSQADANTNTAALPNNYQTPSTTIFVRIENNTNSSCFDTTSFTIAIDDYFEVNQPEDMFLCDDESNDGVELFDLTTQNNSILAGLVGDFNVTYHVSQMDADANANEIFGLYPNESNAQELFVRIEKTTNLFCYQTQSFFIEVKESPVLDMETEWILCSNETLTVVADLGYDSYLWSTGETTAAIDVTSGGEYTVTVTNTYNTTPGISCSSSKTITVIESNAAVINNVSIIDWTLNENQIRVFVDGLGDYEYSLNGITYQDSNIFSSLLTGEYTVYVRDKLGCGVVHEDVYLLFYPYFFTPNNDTFNDFWQIKFSQTEPNLEILIFDRYGKLLTSLNPRSRGWDGTYNGKNMPASDYWFVVKRPSNGKEYKGHFTLKR